MQNRMIKSIFTAMAILGIMAFAQKAYADGQVRIAIIDSGARGYVDFTKSFTSFSANEDPLDHGTYVAKLTRQNNPKAKIYMLQVCDSQNGELMLSRDAVLKAIKWCTQNDIDIVNMSLVTKYDKKIENAIVNASTSHGVIFIAAAGNKTIASRFAADENGYICRLSKDTKPAFPASSEHVISVGAVDDYGNITDYSGKHCDVYANGKVAGKEGTSFACARITARVANLKAMNPSANTKYILAKLK